MANIHFQAGSKKLIDLALAGTAADLRCALCMTNFSATGDEDTVSAVTLDECDATGYARAALGSEATAVDDTENRAELSAADVVFSSLSGDATRDIQGLLVYFHVTNDTDSVPWVYLDFTSDVVKEATQITVPLSTSDILYIS